MSRRGFTLLEVLTALALIGVLSAIALPSLQRPLVDFAPTLPRERTENLVGEEALASTATVFREADRVLLARFSPSGSCRSRTSWSA